MEHPMNKFMIWGVSHIFGNTISTIALFLKGPVGPAFQAIILGRPSSFDRLWGGLQPTELFGKHLGLLVSSTWRIIPVSKWLVTMVSKSPK